MNFDGIPQKLRDSALWCLWKYKDRDGGATKPLYNPWTGQHASSTDPSTFTDFAFARSVYEGGGYEGMGVGIFDTLAAIDIDHCIDELGLLSDTARDIVERMDSYTEISPSGKGLRIIFTAPGFWYDRDRYYIHNKKAGVEVYIAGCTNKYVTITGNVYRDQPICERSEQVRGVLEEYMRRPQPEPRSERDAPRPPPDSETDQQSLESGLQRDEGFRALYNGSRPNGNESADDLALLNKIVYWVNGNADLALQAFLSSPHYEQKDEAHKKKCDRKDYLPNTIQKAVADLRSTAREDHDRWRQEQTRKDFGVQPTAHSRSLVKASEVPYEPPRWLIAPYFQRGKGTLIQADNGTGKTAFMCAIAAHVSTGRPLLDIPIQTPGDVLILSVEDDLPVLRGRIEASGGNLDRCHFMTNAAGLTFNSPEVEAAVKKVNARMVIFDPFQAFLGASVNIDKSNQTRPELAKLFEMGERNDCSIAIIAHIGKGSAFSSVVNRSLGSVDIPSAMRSIFQLTRNPENENECVAVHVKCSNAPKGRSLSFTIGDRGGVEWKGYSPMTADDLTVIVKRKEKGVPYDNEPLVQVLNQMVTDKPGGGFWPYGEVKEIGMRVLGFPPFSTTADLKAKLDGPLARELLEHDGLIVTHSQRGSHGVRGIRIEQYQHPSSYQTKLSTGEGDGSS